MFNERLEICSIRGYKYSNVEVSIFLETQSEIISFSKNLNSIGNISNSTNKFLVCSWSSSSTTNLPIKTGSDHQTDTELISSLSISSCNRPYHVTGSVSDSLSNWVTSFFLFVNKRILHQWVNFNKFLRWDKISSYKLSDGQADCMLNLRWWGNVQNVVDDIKDHILAESTSNFTESFCCILTDSCFFLSQSFN